jgi:hypothetical protein
MLSPPQVRITNAPGLLQTFRGRGGEVFTLAFSPDGKRIPSTS